MELSDAKDGGVCDGAFERERAFGVECLSAHGELEVKDFVDGESNAPTKFS